ncbi:hypothetical protein ACH347_24765 [Saccharopolyspora sp. 5N102]|uniref:hypothetical protein n=1 Tax=Saccharopolyspora sp. 5N102 TaxID=3375155 RepID=UPI0037961BDD
MNDDLKSSGAETWSQDFPYAGFGEVGWIVLEGDMALTFPGARNTGGTADFRANLPTRHIPTVTANGGQQR